jgi:hypothetical protein
LEEVRQNPFVIQEELDLLTKEMRALKQRVKLIDLYHHWMEEFNNLKMEHAFMKVELLIYHKRSKRNLADQWEFYKKQVSKIIQKVFESD